MASASGRTPHVVVERGRERPVSSAARPRRILEHPTGDAANPVTGAPYVSRADECAWWQQVGAAPQLRRPCTYADNTRQPGSGPDGGLDQGGDDEGQGGGRDAVDEPEG